MLMHENISGQETVLDFEYPATECGIQRVFNSWLLCVCIKILKAWNLSIRWTALDKRLTATGEKIEKIRAGMSVTAPAVVSAETAAGDGAAALDQEPESAEGSAFAESARALPVDMDAVRNVRSQTGPADGPADAGTADAVTEGSAAVSAERTGSPLPELLCPDPSEIADSFEEGDPFEPEESGGESDPAGCGVPDWLIRRMFGADPDIQIRTGSVLETAPPGV